MSTVHVLTYCYRYGETVAVYSSKENALKAAALTVAEYFDEIQRPEDRKQIAKALNAQDYNKALELWGEYQNDIDGESIDIKLCELDGGFLDDDKPIHVNDFPVQ